VVIVGCVRLGVGYVAGVVARGIGIADADDGVDAAGVMCIISSLLLLMCVFFFSFVASVVIIYVASYAGVLVVLVMLFGVDAEYGVGVVDVVDVVVFVRV